MPAILEFDENEKLAVFKISGELSLDELNSVQKQCEVFIRQVGNINILVMMDNFIGWHKESGWEDMSFAERNDQYLSKIAIVGELKWKDLAYAFTVKGLRPVDIEFFPEGEEKEARSWLSGENG